MCAYIGLSNNVVNELKLFTHCFKSRIPFRETSFKILSDRTVPMKIIFMRIEFAPLIQLDANFIFAVMMFLICQCTTIHNNLHFLKHLSVPTCNVFKDLRSWV